MSKYLKLFLFVIVPLAIVAGLIAWKIPITRGLDIAGGIRVVLQADPQRGDDWPKTSDKRLEKMRSIRKTITERVKGIQVLVSRSSRSRMTTRSSSNCPALRTPRTPWIESDPPHPSSSTTSGMFGARRTRPPTGICHQYLTLRVGRRATSSEAREARA